MCLPRGTQGGGDGGAPMAKKDDAVSKRLAEEIALAKRITDGIKNNPPHGLLDLATADQRDELAASLWLNEKDPFFGPISRAFVIITTNHKADGIYLPPDDRRHHVAWSALTKEAFSDDYWRKLWGYYDNGGDRHVAAYLAARDIS